MILYVAGGCSEHGRNAFLVKGNAATVLVDAGKMKEKPDEPYPVLSDEQIAGIDYLFLTHSHTDHTGAMEFLKERGFRGVVVASAATLRMLPAGPERSIVLHDRGCACEEFELAEGLHVTWGRAGHCIGSVWYRIRMDGHTVLFTGDYEEMSLAYRCDHIRGASADLAVVDCAYGTEREDAAEHWRNLETALDQLVHTGRPLLFPVPSHGRGFDVVRLLAERGVEVVVTDSLVQEFDDTQNRDFWLMEEFLASIRKLNRKNIRDFRADFEETLAKGRHFPEKYLNSAILVRDSQLVKEENREIARGVAKAGGRTILTGKQDPASYARQLLNEGKADFYRISVHQNIDEMRRLTAENQFGKIAPYHCREALRFEEPEILVLKPGDSVAV